MVFNKLLSNSYPYRITDDLINHFQYYSPFYIYQDFDGFDGRTSIFDGRVREGICRRSATICPISSG